MDEWWWRNEVEGGNAKTKRDFEVVCFNVNNRLIGLKNTGQLGTHVGDDVMANQSADSKTCQCNIYDDMAKSAYTQLKM